MGVKSADGHALEMDAVYDTICAGEWQWNGFDRLRARTRADGMNAAKTGRRFGAVTACLLLAGAFAGVLPAQAARVRSAQTTAPLLYPALFGVAATSANDAWAVGQYQSASGPLRTLIMHWNGTAWARVPSPNPDPAGDTLSGVAAVSATDAWAVGGRNGQTLILRWNGKAWRQMPGPNLAGALAAVTVTSATDAWAVGLDGPAGNQGIIEHWNGKAWTAMRSPVPTGNLDSVTATSASDVWAAGYSGNSTVSHALVLHWNGTAWRRVSAPDPAGNGIFYGVAAASASDAWVVSGAAQKALGVNKTVIEHWNGTAWTRVPSANPKPGGGVLTGVSAASATDAWAVGIDEDFAFSFEIVIEHWDGTAWTLVNSPVTDGGLYGVTALSARDAWAIGGDTGGALIEHWNGTRWSATTVP